MQKILVSILFLYALNLYSETAESWHFNPQQVAKEEVAAWKDYYDNDVAGLVQHISHLAIVEFRLNQFTVWTTVIPELAAAAITFKNLPQNTQQSVYESQVLPHLAAAFEGVREAMHGSWDSHQAAQEELQWWVARRNDKTNDPEIVGKKIANLYSLIYEGQTNPHFDRAGYLRAVAARYRDLAHDSWSPMEEQDWIIIENLLELSYKELLLGIEGKSR